jgi:hypothetical protein
MDVLVKEIYGKSAKKQADLGEATTLAHDELLGRAFERDLVAELAAQLHNGPMPYSTHDLAAAVALATLRNVPVDKRLRLMNVQLTARMKVSQWMTEGKVAPVFARVFEDTLYRDYNPTNLS